VNLIIYIFWKLKSLKKIKKINWSKKNQNGGENPEGSYFELNSRANRQLIKKSRRVICWYMVLNQNTKFKVCRFENDDNARLRGTGEKS
jgi:hypothetical protein